jgi:hypothetical protein
MDQIEFEVGGRYENMKGEYEVLSISNETMQIRWDSGEEITTDIDFQRRIIERMQYEHEQRLLEKAKREKKAAGGGRVKFEGLKEGDFSKKVSGTTWRRRSCLGGAVKVYPNSDNYEIKSWSIARKPMIQWADVKHREPKIFNLQSKFFVRLNEEKLYCGYCIERAKSQEENKGDWDSFLEWMNQQENEQHLKELSFGHDLAVYQFNKDGAPIWKVSSTKDEWKIQKRDEEQTLDSLCDFLKDFSSSYPRMDLQIAASVDKQEAISRGVDIAKDISKVFESLFPIYEASITLGAYR